MGAIKTHGEIEDNPALRVPKKNKLSANFPGPKANITANKYFMKIYLRVYYPYYYFKVEINCKVALTLASKA